MSSSTSDQRAIDATQSFIEWIERHGFADLLRMTSEAVRVEIECSDTPDVRRIERLTTLAEHLEDVAREEAKS